MPIILDQTAIGGSGGRLVQAGMTGFTYAPNAPTGYLVRDGSLVPVALYPNLFAILGYTYGGAGALFGLPDDRGLGDAGAGLGTALAGLTNHVLGVAYGAETRTLTTAEMPTHNHTQQPHNHTQQPHTHADSTGHNHTQQPHTHADSTGHNHTQQPHTHAQNSHNHTQNAHSHTSAATSTPSSDGNSLIRGALGPNNWNLGTTSVTATNQATTATNQNTTAVNDAAFVTVDSETATNDAAFVTVDAETATNDPVQAINDAEGGGMPFSILSPRRYLTPIIAY